MKLKPIFVSSAFAVSCFFLQAQDAPKANVEMPAVVVYGHDRETPKANGVLYEPEKHFVEFVGMGVRNFQNEKLGKIKFITADLENARLVEVVISSGGGFMGIGARTTSVPPSALTFDATGEVARLNMSKAMFDAASRFDTNDVAAYSHPERVAAVSRYFGRVPWFDHVNQTAGKGAQLLRLGYVQKTESIINLPIRSTRGQFLGKVQTLMMDLPKGQITYVVDDTEAMSGQGAHILQPRALRYNAARNGLVLDETFGELKNEPIFKWSTYRAESFQVESRANAKIMADNNPHPQQNVQQKRSIQAEQKSARGKYTAHTNSSSAAVSTPKIQPQAPRNVGSDPRRMLASSSQTHFAY